MPTEQQIVKEVQVIVHKLSLKHWLMIAGAIVIILVLASLFAVNVIGNIKKQYDKQFEDIAKVANERIKAAEADAANSRTQLESVRNAQANRRSTITKTNQKEVTQLQTQKQALSNATPGYLLDKMRETINADPASMRDTGQGIEVSYIDAKAFIELGIDYKVLQSDLKATAGLYDSCMIEKAKDEEHIINQEKTNADVLAASKEQVAQVNELRKKESKEYEDTLKQEKAKNSLFGSIKRFFKTAAITIPFGVVLGIAITLI